MIVRVKLCGLTRLEDVLLGVELGVDAFGFNFVEDSPRRITPAQARDLCAAVPPFTSRVGVFADQLPRVMEATALLAGLTCLQLHGDEPPESCRSIALPWYKAHRVGPDFVPESVSRYRSSTCLLDAHVPGRKGGTGTTFDWTVARLTSAYARVIVAGGLTPVNVGDAIAAARPYGIDVSSGVESAPGKKDRRLLSAFMKRVREAAMNVEENG
ncbi:MAG TPA: phosphoribosylanthranilate isomerase [Candidatus Dormibacteraeota bacterium]|nr:phosphoribosylanthranilate isomerase [Candidatus Dormibacteraeota bacterium]